jgi:hypothetical protein
MDSFLSRYYLLTNETLPEVINLQTIESLAQHDIPGIFTATKLPHITLTDAQTLAIKDFRTVFAKNYNYRREWLAEWEQNFNRQYGVLANLLGGWAWVALVPTGVYVVAQGELLVWRIRANEPPLFFENHDAVEPTQTGDVWLITWDKEIAKPTVQTASAVALEYAQKLDAGQTKKERFDILMIENQVNISKLNQNQTLKRRVMAIHKRLEAAALFNKAVVEPPQNKIPMEPLKEMGNASVIPFIDYVAAFFIKKQKVDNQNLMCIDFGIDKTSIYKFKIENQRFIYQSEWQFETPQSTQQLISSVEKEKVTAALGEIQDVLDDPDLAALLGEQAEHVHLTFGNIINGINEWIEKCIQNIDNHKVEHYALLTNEWLMPTLSKAFQKRYPKFTGEMHGKNLVQEVGSKLYDDTIYPNLTKNIGFQLYDDKNEATNASILNAGMPYKAYSQANYLPFRSWVLLNAPFVPTILVDNKRFELGSIDLDKLGQQPTKKMGQYLLADFHFGLSINGHFELILHLKNNFKITSFNIGKL